MDREQNGKKCLNINFNGKKSMLTLGIASLLSLAIGGTLAYIAVVSNQVANQFTPAQVSCEVVVNSNTVNVKNTSDIDAYLRAAIVVNWVVADGENKGNVRGIAPVKNTDYTLVINSTDNIDGSEMWYDDGNYYYYKDAVALDTLAATPLISDIEILGVEPTGYELSVEVVAEAIQAEGVNVDEISPLQLHWGEDAAEWVGIYKAN